MTLYLLYILQRPTAVQFILYLRRTEGMLNIYMLVRGIYAEGDI